MNVNEILKEIPRRYPKHELKSMTDDSVDSHWFRIYPPNKWLINVGYSRRDYSSNRVQRLEDPNDATHVEVSIFRPNNEYYIAEGMTTWEFEDGEEGRVTSGYYGWFDLDKLFEVIDYISQM